MKKLIIVTFLFLSAVLFGCKKEGFQLYESGDYIQFTKHINDSVLSSFLAFPDQDSRLLPLRVELVGHPSETARRYRISVVQSETTASSSNYSIPDEFSFG